MALPESNHTSRTSGMRLISFPHSHSRVISSMYGLCSSLMGGSSSFEPMTFVLPQEAHFHIGRGMPQYLWREMHQSGAFETNSRNRSFAKSGCQSVLSISFSIWSFILDIVMNHCFVVRNISGVLQRQQCG